MGQHIHAFCTVGKKVTRKKVMEKVTGPAIHVHVWQYAKCRHLPICRSKKFLVVQGLSYIYKVHVRRLFCMSEFTRISQNILLEAWYLPT